jgi:hypothetical protein
LIWDATRKQWRSTWHGQPISLEFNDDGAEDLETVLPFFEAALKLEPNAREHLIVWIERQAPELSKDETIERLLLFHLGCEADGIIWFVYKTGDLIARSNESVMVTLHEDGRFERIGFPERN